MLRISSALWHTCKDLALASATHPFILSLYRGTLHESAFKSYVAQDVFYLKSFRRAYGRAAELCALSNDVFGNSQFLSLQQGVDEELKLHDEYSKKLSIELSVIVPLPQTVLYTEFLDYATTKSVALICASMVPCMALYAFLGKRGLTHGYMEKEHIYSRWMEEYSSLPFQDLAERLESLLDHYAEIEGLDVPKLLPSYSKAMELEYAFFSAHTIRSWNGYNPTDLFIDFDNTLSEKDTISRLCQGTMAAQRDQLPKNYILNTNIDGDTTNSETDNNNLFTVLEKLYTEKLSTFLKDKLPSTHLPFNPDVFHQIMSDLTDMDVSMISPVEESKILSGISVNQLQQLGKSITLKEGAEHALDYAQRRISPKIITLNWSSIFVQSALQRSTSIHSNNLRNIANINDESIRYPLKIYSNDLELDVITGISNGKIKQSLTGALHKSNLIQQLTSSVTPTVTSFKTNEQPIVYIGDSISDLAAMITVDIGIVIQPRESFRNMCKSLGISILPLEDIIQLSPNDSNNSTCSLEDNTNTSIKTKCIYEAESWAHIGFCLFGRHYTSEWFAVRRQQRYFPFTAEDLNNIKSESTAEDSMNFVPRVLTVAGSDSGGGAGIQADVKTCDATNVFATTAITAITAQNTLGVMSVHKIPIEELRSQLDAVLADIGSDAVKTGMLPSAEAAREVVRAVTQYAVPNLVVDPVMVSTSGSRLMSEEDVVSIRNTLFPVALLVTPNLLEARALLDCPPLTSIRDMETAAKAIFEYGPAYVLVKGGHLKQATATESVESLGTSTSSPIQAQMIDVLYDGRKFIHISESVIDTSNTHGTGCTLSAAIACYLAKGYSMENAVRAGRKYLHQTLFASKSLKIGQGFNGPMWHSSAALSQAFSLGKSVDTQRNTDINTVSKRSILGDQWVQNPSSFALRIYAVTDSALNKKNNRTLEEVVQRAIDGGVEVIQIREKDISTSEYISLASNILKLTKSAGKKLIINDRVDVALAIGADGVHVGQNDMNAAIVRQIVGKNMIIGVSARTIEEAVQAQFDGADYIGVGAVYGTSTKRDAVTIGLDGLKRVKESVQIPVVGIGGIQLGEPLVEVLEIVDGAAVVSGIFGAENIYTAASIFSNFVRKRYPLE